MSDDVGYVLLSCPRCERRFKIQRPEGPNATFIQCSDCEHVFVLTIERAASLTLSEQDAHGLAELALPASPATSSDDPTAMGTAVDAKAFDDQRGHRREGLLHTKGRAVELKKFRTILGSHRADVALDDQDVAEHHAVIEWYDDRFLIKDAGSPGGTYINGKRITVQLLADGDEIRMGRSVLRFKVR